jgi:hypothetical protein
LAAAPLPVCTAHVKTKTMPSPSCLRPTIDLGMISIPNATLLPTGFAANGVLLENNSFTDLPDAAQPDGNGFTSFGTQRCA